MVINMLIPRFHNSIGKACALVAATSAEELGPLAASETS
jgi:hypothetical protein